MVEEIIVRHVDEKLSTSGMRVGGSGHGDRVMVIFEPVFGFVFNGFLAFLLFHAWRKAATLDHEARNDAMKNGVVVMSTFNMFDEICNRDGRFFSIEFKSDQAVFGNMDFNSWIGHGYLMMEAEVMITLVLGTSLGKGPEGPVGMDFILSTTSMPETTLPKTV